MGLTIVLVLFFALFFALGGGFDYIALATADLRKVR
jgi:hypothetical protein